MQSTTTTRRALVTGLAGATAVAATAAASRQTIGAEADPAFAVIEHLRRCTAPLDATYDALDKAEGDAQDVHGIRPTELIVWRNYQIGGHEIEQRRDDLIRSGRFDPAKIEREYLDAKQRERDAIRAGEEWDHRAGVAGLRRKNEEARAAYHDACERLAGCVPSTAAGAVALLAYCVESARSFGGDVQEWEFEAIANATDALARLGGGA
jgi:hypothetical protein